MKCDVTRARSARELCIALNYIVFYRIVFYLKISLSRPLPSSCYDSPLYGKF